MEAVAGRSSGSATKVIPALPPEIWTIIFQYYSKKLGVSYLVSTIAQVCVSWRKLITNACFWTRVKDSKLTADMLAFLCRQKVLYVTTHISLQGIPGLKRHIPLIVSNWKKVKTASLNCEDFGDILLDKLSENCRKIRFLKLTGAERRLRPPMFYSFLHGAGVKLAVIYITDCRMASVSTFLHSIADFCPNLRKIHMNKIRGYDLVFPVTRFQLKCPKLICIEMQNFEFLAEECEYTVGFPELNRLICRSDGYYPTLDDAQIVETLKGSLSLHTLDICGTEVTIAGLARVAVWDLQQLFASRSVLAGCPVTILENLKRWKYWERCEIKFG